MSMVSDMAETSPIEYSAEEMIMEIMMGHALLYGPLLPFHLMNAQMV